VRTKRILSLALLPLALCMMAEPANARTTHVKTPAVHVALDSWGVAQAATLAFWTPTRMQAATPVDNGVKAAVKADVTPTSDATSAVPPPAKNGTMSAAGSSIPYRHVWTGSPVIGALFSSDGRGTHYCTASVVTAPKKNLIITAGHCLYDASNHTWRRNVAFVPHFWKGHSPYGIWPVQMETTDTRWQKHGDQDLDFAFATVASVHGRALANAVGGSNKLIINQGYSNSVLVAGYPMKKYASINLPIYCFVHTYKEKKYQIGMNCRGFYGGTSGSPWLKNYNSHCRCGSVMGVIGGYEQGGKYDYTSYASVFDHDVYTLYKGTVARS
jgi:V8-like Glu-specific endopeptidase